MHIEKFVEGFTEGLIDSMMSCQILLDKEQNSVLHEN